MLLICGLQNFCAFLPLVADDVPYATLMAYTVEFCIASTEDNTLNVYLPFKESIQSLGAKLDKNWSS